MFDFFLSFVFLVVGLNGKIIGCVIAVRKDSAVQSLPDTNRLTVTFDKIVTKLLHFVNK